MNYRADFDASGGVEWRQRSAPRGRSCGKAGKASTFTPIRGSSGECRAMGLGRQTDNAPTSHRPPPRGLTWGCRAGLESRLLGFLVPKGEICAD
jgi:hypothetical protein